MHRCWVTVDASARWMCGTRPQGSVSGWSLCFRPHDGKRIRAGTPLYRTSWVPNVQNNCVYYHRIQFSLQTAKRDLTSLHYTHVSNSLFILSMHTLFNYVFNKFFSSYILLLYIFYNDFTSRCFILIWNMFREALWDVYKRQLLNCCGGKHAGAKSCLTRIN